MNTYVAHSDTISNILQHLEVVLVHFVFHFLHMRADMRAVHGRPSHALSIIESLPSPKRPIHSYIAEGLILATPYTANNIAQILVFILPDLTKNLIITVCSIIGLYSVVQKNGTYSKNSIIRHSINRLLD